VDGKNHTVAVKAMKHQADPKDRIFNVFECQVLKFCHHPNIVRYVDSCESGPDEIWLGMEFMEGGTLDQAVRAFTFAERQIAYVAREMLRGIAYLHSENLLHRDLKSANVMMTTKGEIKLIDFGLCVDITSGPKTAMVGSPFWMPPEMINRRPHDYKVDIWSLGICMTELANGCPPNQRSSFKAMFEVATVGYDRPLSNPMSWSKDFITFVDECLRFEATQRPSAHDLLQHPFVREANCDSPETMKEIISGIFVLNAVLPF